MRKSYYSMRIALCCVIWLTSNSTVRSDDRPALVQTASKTEGPASAESVEIREFDVRVDNKLLGTHRIEIKSTGNTQEVAVQTDVRVNVVVYVYVFKFRGNEVWRDGRLLETENQCDDGGKKRSMSLKSKGTVQEIAFNGKAVSNSSRCLMSNSYWRLPATDVRSKLIPIVNVDTGATDTASLTEVDTTPMTISGRTMACRHFKIDGPSPADLWFDDQDRLVGQKSVEQGHPTELRLKLIRNQNQNRIQNADR